jgi:hypothetical protein
LAVGDLNGDSVPDIAIGSRSAGSRAVLMYQDPSRRGSFRPAVDLAVPGTYCTELAIGDLNADGRADLLMSISLPPGSDTSRGVVGYTLQQPDGSVGSIVTFGSRTNLGVETLAIADYDGDRRNDILAYLTPSGGGATHRLTVALQGPAPGTFGVPVDTLLSRDDAGLGGAAFVDLSGDGRPEAVVGGLESQDGSRVNSRVSYFVQSGNGGFAVASRRDVAIGIARFAAGDVDGDGRADLVLLDQRDRFQVLPTTGAVGF